jgi:hypothetical protein
MYFKISILEKEMKIFSFTKVGKYGTVPQGRLIIPKVIKFS